MPPPIAPGQLPGQQDPTQVQPAPAPVTNVDIAPAGSAAAPAPAQPAAAPAATATTTPATTSSTPSIGAPNGLNGGLFSVDQTTKTAADEVQAARVAVTTVGDQITKQQALVESLQGTSISQDPTVETKLQAATNTLNALYGDLGTANNRVAAATASYQTAISKAIDQNQVDPTNVQLAQASAAKAAAEGNYAATQAKVLSDGAPSQRAVSAAQVTAYNAQAAASQAQADAQSAKTPAEVQQLTAQANQLQSQADQTNALLPGLIKQQAAATDQTVAQTHLTDANSDLAVATTGKTNADTAYVQAQTDYQNAVTKGLLPANIAESTSRAGLNTAQAGLAGAEGTNQLASAAGTLATIQQNLQGPLYGLQDRVNAIKQIQQQVFGPGGSGDPNEANDLLQQYVDASIAGTTPYAANVAAANAGLTAFGTQASLANAANAALASRAGALGSVGSNALQTLAALNANAPKGSTALAGAFRDVIDYMSNKMNTGALAMAPQPTAPALPALLQRLAPGGGPAGAPPPVAVPGATGGAPAPGGGPAAAGPAAAPPPAAGPAAPAVPGAGPSANPGMTGIVAGGPAPPPMAGPAAHPGGTGIGPGGPVAPAPAPAPQSGAPVTININSSAPQNPAASGISYSGAPASGPWPMANWPGQGGSPAAQLPGVLAQHAPASVDAVHQLWGNELSSGAIKSPYPQYPNLGVGATGGAAGPVGQMAPSPEPTGVSSTGGPEAVTTGSQPPYNPWPGVQIGPNPYT